MCAHYVRYPLVVEGWVVLNVYTAIVLVLLLVFQSKTIHTRSGNKFSQLVAMTLILLLSETLGHIGEIFPSQFFILTKVGYFLIFALDPVDYLFAILYIDCFINNEKSLGRKIFILAFKIFVYLNLVLVILSAIFRLGWFFTFDGNEYHRGSFYMIRAALLLVFCLLLSVYSLVYRGKIYKGYVIPILRFQQLRFLERFFRLYLPDLLLATHQ